VGQEPTSDTPAPRAPGEPPERRHDPEGVGPGEGDRVRHDLGAEPAELGDVLVEPVPVPEDVPTARR
jgi:hypothetical protein